MEVLTVCCGTRSPGQIVTESPGGGMAGSWARCTVRRTQATLGQHLMPGVWEDSQGLSPDSCVTTRIKPVRCSPASPPLQQADKLTSDPTGTPVECPGLDDGDRRGLPGAVHKGPSFCLPSVFQQLSEGVNPTDVNFYTFVTGWVLGQEGYCPLGCPQCRRKCLGFVSGSSS